MLEAIPNEPERKKAQQFIRQAYRDAYQAKTQEAHLLLARKLLDQGATASDEAPIQFELFEEARQSAISARSVDLALEAVQRQADRFDVDALALDAEVLGAICSATTDSAGFAAIAYNCISLIDVAQERERLDIVDRASSTGMTSALKSGDNDLIAAVKEQSAVAKERLTALSAAKQALAANPLDPTASLILGSHLFIQGRWPEGLRLLGQANDEVLKAIVAKDRGANDSSDKAFEVAEDWLQYADKCSGVSRVAARKRGVYWYEKIMPTLKGVKRTLAERRLQEARNDHSSGDSGKATETSIVRPSSRCTVFLCDASGTMMTVMPRVRTEVASAINSLQPNQNFNVVFFKDAEVLAFNDKKPSPATEQIKAQAIQFLEKVSAAGLTDPVRAIRLSFEQKPDQICLFSDGFDNVDDFNELLKVFRDLNRKKSVRVDCCLIRASNDGTLEKQLKQIAAENGGQFRAIAK